MTLEEAEQIECIATKAAETAASHEVESQLHDIRGMVANLQDEMEEHFKSLRAIREALEATGFTVRR